MTLTDAQKDVASAADLKTALVVQELLVDKFKAKLNKAEDIISRFIEAAEAADQDGDWTQLDAVVKEAMDL
jgi:hypothetical protein